MLPGSTPIRLPAHVSTHMSAGFRGAGPHVVYTVHAGHEQPAVHMIKLQPHVPSSKLHVGVSNGDRHADCSHDSV